MNIGIDGYEANVEKRVGIGQYSYQVITHLLEIDQTNHYSIFLPTKPLADMPKASKRLEYMVGKPGSLWTVTQLPFLAHKKPLDVFFSPTHYGPVFSRAPLVLSIMDLSYIHYPELFRKKDLLQLKHMGRFSIRRAKHILTISEFTKSEIEKEYGVKSKNITVTYPGVNPDLQDPLATTHKKLKITQPYILFVGTIQPRKNLSHLIEAFGHVKDPALQLVIAGKKGWLYEPIFEAIKNSPKKNLIRVLDFVADGDLPALYEGAECLILPSLYEGFGIPVVEAMQYGCMVIASKTSSLPEIGGDAALYFDPEKPADIAKAIDKVLQLKPEERRNRIRSGYEQVKKFSWKMCAQRTLEVLEKVGS